MDFERICRICLNERECYLRIYQKHFNYDSLLYEIVNDVCQLEIKLEDGLPEFICDECGQKIKEFHTFKKIAHCSRTTLENIKQNTENTSNNLANVVERGASEGLSCIQDEVYLPPVKSEIEESIDIAVAEPLELNQIPFKVENLENNEENPSVVGEPTPVAVQCVLPSTVNIDVTNNNNTSGNISNKWRLPLLILRSDGVLVPSTAGQIELRSSNFRNDGKPGTFKAGISQSPNVAERTNHGGEVNHQAYASNNPIPDGMNNFPGKISVKSIESLMGVDQMEDTTSGISSSESTLIDKHAKSGDTVKNFMDGEESSNEDDGDVVSVDDVGKEAEEYDESTSSTSQESDSDDIYVPDSSDEIRRFKPVPFELKVKVVNLAKKNPTWRLSTLQNNGTRKLQNRVQLRRWIKQVESGGNQVEKYKMVRKLTLDRYIESVRKNKSVTTKTIRNWALSAARKHFPHNFKFRASTTWLSKLKKEYRMRQQKDVSDAEREASDAERARIAL